MSKLTKVHCNLHYDRDNSCAHRSDKVRHMNRLYFEVNALVCIYFIVDLKKSIIFEIFSTSI